jgi:hypothetical protein
MEFTELIESCYGKLIGGKALTTGEKKKIKQASTKDKVAIFHHTYTPGLARKYNLVKAYIEEPSITTLLDHFTYEYGLAYALTDWHAKYHELLKDGNHVQAFKKVKWEIDKGFHTFLKEQLEHSKHNADKIYNSVKEDLFFSTLFGFLNWHRPKDDIINGALKIGIKSIDAEQIADRYKNALTDPLRVTLNPDQKNLINKLLLAFGHYDYNKHHYHLIAIPGKQEYYFWLYLMGENENILPIFFEFFLQPKELIIANTSKTALLERPFTPLSKSLRDKFKKQKNRKHVFTFHGFSIFLYDHIYINYHGQSIRTNPKKKQIQEYYLTLLHNLHQVTKTFNNQDGFNPKNLSHDSSDDFNPWNFWRTKREYSRRKLI